MAGKENTRTELSELGEFGLIRHLTRGLRCVNPHTLVGVGDDAAVADAGGKRILISTDLLVEGVHFDLTYTPLRHLGFKAAAVNFSDIAAMNGSPAQMTVGLAISNRFSLEAVEEIYAGMRLACDKYGVDLVGGDTTSSVSGLFLSITVLGYADEKDVVLRSTAREHDLICVSGDLGGAYAGLLVLEREKAVFRANPEMQPDLQGHDYVLQRQLRPEPRFDVLRLLREAQVLPTAMIDISDGLASDLLHICSGSGTGAAIYTDKIPVDPATAMVAEEFSMDPLTFALSGGEDYELLFTISLADHEKVKNLPEISFIGHITEPAQGVNLVSSGGTMVPVTAQGWDSLRKKGS